MKYIAILLLLLIGGCVPVHRKVEWETDQTTITNEKGTETIGVKKWKKKGNHDDQNSDSSEANQDAQAFSLIPLRNEIYDFSRWD